MTEEKDLSSKNNPIKMGSLQHQQLMQAGFKVSKAEALKHVDLYTKDPTTVPYDVYSNSKAFLASLRPASVTTKTAVMA